MKSGALLLLGLCLAFYAQSATVNFDSDPVNAPPAGWTAALTGKGETKWQVVKDETAPSQPHALKQSGQGTFPICIKDAPVFRNGFVHVKFKAVSGKEDQAAGLIWRCKDANNYYIARANALEDNVEIYHTKDGKRRSFKEVACKVAGGVWHTLRVDFNGNRFTVTFNGQALIQATDETFPDAGRVGLWTKADSVTLFDDFMFAAEEQMVK